MWRKITIFANQIQLFFMKKYLIAGLGNPGEEYQNTRHNIGFLALDKIAQKNETSFSTQKLGDIASFSIKGRNITLLKPSTFMNLSGKSIRYWMEKENIPQENILVICDDLNLPFPVIRLKKKGSAGGHNGLKNIEQELKTDLYPRLRFGISNSFEKGKQIDYVLGQWSGDEQEKIPQKLETVAEVVISFVLEGVDVAMNKFNANKN